MKNAHKPMNRRLVDTSSGAFKGLCIPMASQRCESLLLKLIFIRNGDHTNQRNENTRTQADLDLDALREKTASLETETKQRH
jgi:hypothetical protein